VATTENTAETAELVKLKEGARAAWSAGDYPAIAERQLWPVGALVVARIGVQTGDDVLDVACGTGNAAIRAAQAGGRVVGVDLTPELFEAGRRLARDAHVAIDWVEGDAEELPFPDGAFDVVVSTFGCMFAPRHRVTAHELARVLRPGGRLCVTAWTPEGAMGAFFRTVAGFLPPPSPLAEPPALWGSEQHVRELFDGTGMELEFDRDTVDPVPFDSTDDAIEFMTAKFGPLIMARRLNEASGRWSELRATLAKLYEHEQPMEYLIVTGKKVNR
jgi:ubiquinone/menaquinone biosynthesis C-methylase UbiE